MAFGDSWLSVHDGASAPLVGQVCTACVRLIPVSGAAATVTTPAGYRGTVFATDAVSARIEELHFELGEGPGVDALRDRRPVLVGDLTDGAQDRWPVFSAAAVSAGARAVFAYPLLLGAGQLGVLTMYRDRPDRLDPDQRAQAARIVHAASFAVLDLMSGLTDRAPPLDAEDFVIDTEFQHARVYQAAGMIMVQLGVGIEEALVRLRAHAFSEGRLLGDVAEDIVSRMLRLDGG